MRTGWLAELGMGMGMGLVSTRRRKGLERAAGRPAKTVFASLLLCSSRCAALRLPKNKRQYFI